MKNSKVILFLFLLGISKHILAQPVERLVKVIVAADHSDWTYKKQINSVLLKQNAAKELGYKYEFWIYDKKGNKITS